MKSGVRNILLVALALFILYVKLTTSSTTPAPAAALPASTSPAAVSAAPAASTQVTDESVPTKALQVLQIVRSTGQPPEGYVGGRVFENRESRLPGNGDYREFDIDPHNGQRNAERLIVEWKSKKAWYTGDHYRTFTPLP